MRQTRPLPLLAAFGLLALCHLGGVLGLKLHRAAQEQDSLRAQVERVQAGVLAAKTARQDRRDRVQAAFREGRVHPRMAADRVRAQLDQMITGLAGGAVPLPAATAAAPAPALASNGGVLVLAYRTALECEAGGLESLLDALAQARPGLLVTALAVTPAATPGRVTLGIEGIALLEP